jgi:purine-nucleoside phosphorylase
MLEWGSLYERARISAGVLKDRIDERAPRVAIVLGSALGGVAEAIADPVVVPFSDVPHVREPSVAGHAGAFASGRIEGLEAILVAGRLHLYEGHDAREVTFPIRVLAALGVETVILTNAAGAVAPSLGPGDLMAIEDQINLTGRSPLVGLDDERLGPRFLDASAIYDRGLRELFAAAAAAEEVELRSGVYAGVLGPAYETPAEVAMLRAIGADAVGMSTVVEALAARHAGCRVAGVSVITNAAGGEATLTHEGVMAGASNAVERLTRLLVAVCRRLA